MSLELLLDQLKQTLLLVPFVITILFCINLGAVLKRAKYFPDNRIPFWLGPIGGLVYTLICFFWDQDYRSRNLPLNIGIGFITGWSTTGLHQVLLHSEYFSKLKFLRWFIPPTGNTEILKNPNLVDIREKQDSQQTKAPPASQDPQQAGQSDVRG